MVSLRGDWSLAIMINLKPEVDGLKKAQKPQKERIESNSLCTHRVNMSANARRS